MLEVEMTVSSVNIGERKSIDWKGQKVETGIFKYPVDVPICLRETDVENDAVVDRRFHGGVDKAVYAYSLEHYPFWKNLYPKLDWDYGMFGENLTVEGLDESKMLIGSTYQLGEAVIQVCQPRQPCMKLGIRFGTQEVLKKFVDESYPGIYFRVLNAGLVDVHDQFELITEEEESPSIADVYRLMYHKLENAQEVIAKALDCQFLPASCKDRILSTQA